MTRYVQKAEPVGVPLDTPSDTHYIRLAQLYVRTYERERHSTREIFFC